MSTMNLLYFKLSENCFTYMIHAADAQGLWWKKKSWDCNFSFQRWTLTLQTQGQTTAPPSVHWGERSLPLSQQASRDVLNGDRFCWEKPHSFSLSRCLNVFLWFIQDLVLSKAVRTADSVYTALSTGYHKVCYTVLKCEEMKRSQ